jgi:hypothetical protein
VSGAPEVSVDAGAPEGGVTPQAPDLGASVDHDDPAFGVPPSATQPADDASVRGRRRP